MPSVTCTVLTSLTSTMLKFQKPPMSLKQFMLRSEVLKLYKGFLRLGRLMDTKVPQSTSCAPLNANVGSRNLHPLQLEWIDWVRSEFRLRQGTTEEDLIKMMLTHGKRQLQEMERTILLATNRNPVSSNNNVNQLPNENSSIKRDFQQSQPAK